MAEILHPGSPPPGAAVAANMPTDGNPSNPHAEPYGHIPVPEHVSVGLWQQSWYNPESQAAVSEYVKLPSGPCDLATGRLTGKGFPGHQKFGQV